MLGDRDPQEDAVKAFRSGDKRLLELGGYAPTLPGAESPDGTYHVPPGTTFRMLDGTSDTTTEACYAVKKLAETYARAYNTKLLALAVSDGR